MWPERRKEPEETLLPQEGLDCMLGDPVCDGQKELLLKMQIPRTPSPNADSVQWELSPRQF